MSLRRRAAMLACRLIESALPSRLRPWGRAVRGEVDAIADDGAALRFALASLAGLLPRAAAVHLLRPLAALADTPSSTGDSDMFDHAFARPRAMGIACGIGAVLLGLAHLAMTGAPARYVAINAGALAVGLAVLALAGRVRLSGRDAAMLGGAGVLLATALWGHAVAGAARWITVGPLFVQPSLVMLPLMILCFARSVSWATTAAMIVSAGALAVQPDRAMAGMLAAALLVLATMRRDPFAVAALAASLAAFAITLLRADGLPAAAFVDQVLFTAFTVQPAAGLAVLGGSALLLAPAVLGWRSGESRATYAVFGTVWLAAIAAAALGNYPTPVVGYGGSAVLGYVLSLLALPKATCAGTAIDGPAGAEAPEQTAGLFRTVMRPA